MASLLTLTYSAPSRTLQKGEALVTQGEKGGDLFVLESGSLVVERDGVEIAGIEAPDSVVGEMSVLLGRPYSATVRARRESRVRVIHDAMRILERQPQVALSLAVLLCQRLDATSALLVEYSREGAKASEQGPLRRVFDTLFGHQAEREPG
jgi:CRP-like cAMP-binding protein